MSDVAWCLSFVRAAVFYLTLFNLAGLRVQACKRASSSNSGALKPFGMDRPVEAAPRIRCHIFLHLEIALADCNSTRAVIDRSCGCEIGEGELLRSDPDLRR
jgi:hypothetical protein